MKKVAVVGTGYVGLVNGTCFAETGNQVICVDVDEAKVEKMKRGEVPIYEPELEGLFEKNIKAGRLTFTTQLKEAVDASDIIFLALPTPPGEDGSADLSYVLGVADQLGQIMTDYKVIVDKSTVPVGTAEKVTEAIKKHAKVDFDVVSNPEFLREGLAVKDFMHPDRVVVGSSSDKARQMMTGLYEPFLDDDSPLFLMDEKSAELTKYAANSFLATKITFMNEMANFCEKVGANVDDVRRGIGSDKRIGYRFLYSGVGFGGSCFPKDVQALVNTGKQFGYSFEIVNAVIKANNNQKFKLVEKVKNHFGDIKGKTFAIWGLSFKPNTDDIREAPAFYIIDLLLLAGANIKAFDPKAMKNVPAKYLDSIQLVDDQYDALINADALLIITEWDEFRNADLNRIKTELKQPKIFDGRNLFELSDMEGLGVYYESIGRQTILS